MAEESGRYELVAIRRFLLKAFNTDELDDLFYFAVTAELRAVRNEYADKDSLRTKIRKAMDYCERHDLLHQLLAEMATARPGQTDVLQAELQKADRALQEAEEQAQREEEAYKSELARAKQADGLMAQGLSHLAEGKWWLASQAFRQVLELAPNHAQAQASLEEAGRQEEVASRLVKGQNYFREGRWEEAIACFEAVLETEPGHREAGKRLEEARAQVHAQQEAQVLARRKEEARQAEQARKEAEARIAKVARQEADARAKREEEARQVELFRFYYVACLAAWVRNWPKAIENFEALLLRDLNYRDAADRLKEVRSLKASEELSGLLAKRTGQSQDSILAWALQHRNQALGARPNPLPRRGPRPPEEVLERQRQIMAAGESPSQQKPTGKSVAAAKTAEWEAVAKLRAYSCNVSRAAFSPDGKWLVTAGTGDGDKSAHVWEIATGKLALELGGHSDRVWCAAFSRDGKLLVTTSGDGRARLWQAVTGKMITELRVHKKIFGSGWYVVVGAAFSSDGKRLVTLSGDGKLRLWALATGEMVAEIGGGKQSAESVDVSPDGRWLLTGDEDGTARIWDVQTGKVVSELRADARKLQDAAFSADGKMAVTASEGGTARIWNVGTSNVVRTLKAHEYKTVRSAAFHPSGKWVVTATLAKNALVWEVATGRIAAKLSSSGYGVSSAAFSPDGRWVVAAGEGARVWRVPTA